jgi:zinc transport system permease protein
MALIAAAFGACATLGGLAASLHWDTPTGPSIICCAAALFFTSTLLGALRGRDLS